MPTWVPLDMIPPLPDEERSSEESRFSYNQKFSTQEEVTTSTPRLSPDLLEESQFFADKEVTWKESQLIPLPQACKQLLFPKGHNLQQPQTLQQQQAVEHPKTLTSRMREIKDSASARTLTLSHLGCTTLRNWSHALPKARHESSLPKPFVSAPPAPTQPFTPHLAPTQPLTRHMAVKEKSSSQSPEKKSSTSQTQEKPPLCHREVENLTSPPPQGWWQEREEESKKRRSLLWSIHKGRSIRPVKRTFSFTSENRHVYTVQAPRARPALEPPRLGVFALYYILTKIGIISDATSQWESSQEIRKDQEEMEAVRKLRIEQLKKAVAKEQAAKRWGISLKLFSWLTAFTGLIAGIALIVTGVGAVAGALLVTAGIFTLTNQILEETGGWLKIAALLPGDDPEKKKAVILWMQIGITVLSLILAAAGTIFGGFKVVGEATQHFTYVFGGVAMIGNAVSTLGQGITSYLHRWHMVEGLKQSLRLEQLRHHHQTLMEQVDYNRERLLQLFEDLAKTLDFETELFKADQSIYRSSS